MTNYKNPENWTFQLLKTTLSYYTPDVNRELDKAHSKREVEFDILWKMKESIEKKLRTTIVPISDSQLINIKIPESILNLCRQINPNICEKIFDNPSGFFANSVIEQATDYTKKDNWPYAMLKNTLAHYKYHIHEDFDNFDDLWDIKKEIEEELGEIIIPIYEEQLDSIEFPQAFLGIVKRMF